MANCALTSGIDISCASIKQAAGGVKTKVWLGNLSEVTATYDESGYITDLAFNDYTTQGLVPFNCLKDQNDAGSDGAPTDGGTFMFTHDVVLTLLDLTPAHKSALEDLAFAGITQGVFAVVQTAGDQFRVYGIDFGLSVQSMPGRTGKTGEDATSRVITLSGTQKSLEKIFLDTDVATTLAKIEALELGV
jgi:hypothetical protein